ncbi:MAG: hypothetical protein COA79_12765 [Planctomycetota bacterium]|nr:MAG: hypothetical protein COA79_12765 [Planctomycetota bacterium]
MYKFFIIFLNVILFFNFITFAEEPKKDPLSTKSKDEIKIDRLSKKFYFAADLISSKRMLEVLACTRRGPIHESVFLIPPIGKKLYRGLISIGLNDATKWQLPVKSGITGFDLSLGNKVIMKVYWDGQEESEAVFIEDLLSYESAQVPMMIRGWTFKGEMVTKDGRVLPPDNIEISLENKDRKSNSSILLLNPINFLEVGEPEYIIADKFVTLLKPLNDLNKKKGIIIMQPVSESQIVAMNIKRYPKDEGLLNQNISLAKDIDQLKYKFIHEIRNQMFAVIKSGSDPKISMEDQAKLITEFKKIELNSQILLNKIHYLYYLMLQVELQVIEKHMDKKSQAYCEFKIFSIELIKCVSEEKRYIYESHVNKLKEFLLIQKGEKEDAKKMRLQILMDDTNANIHKLKFRPILLESQIKGDEARLKEQDVVNSVVVKDAISKSVIRNKLDKLFYEKILQKEYLKIILLNSIQKDLSLERKASPELIAFKNATIDVCQVKLSIQKNAYENRLITLKEYLNEYKRDQKYYIDEIKKANKNLKSTNDQIKILEDTRKKFNFDLTNCFAFEEKYKHLIY